MGFSYPLEPSQHVAHVSTESAAVHVCLID
jgi:hypothetical protein